LGETTDALLEYQDKCDKYKDTVKDSEGYKIAKLDTDDVKDKKEIFEWESYSDYMNKVLYSGEILDFWMELKKKKFVGDKKMYKTYVAAGSDKEVNFTNDERELFDKAYNSDKKVEDKDLPWDSLGVATIALMDEPIKKFKTHVCKKSATSIKNLT